jgi:hypothetical protein
MKQSLESPAPSSIGSTAGTAGSTLWRVAGGLAIAHVVLLFAGFSQEKSPILGDSPEVVQRIFTEADLNHVLVGGYVESLSFVVLLPVLVFLARNLGVRTETGRWASQTACAAGLCYVAVTLATGMAAGAAALWGAHHGVQDAPTVALMNTLRDFAFFLSLLVLGVQAMATGVAALSDRAMRRWVGWGGVGVGIALVLGVGAQGVTDAANLSSMLWMFWWVGVGISLIRYADTPR